MEYVEYLESEYWKKLSKKVKDNADNKCQLCNSRFNLEAHHRSYIWKGNPEKEINDLVCLCKACHSNFHGKSKVTVLSSPTEMWQQKKNFNSNKKTTYIKHCNKCHREKEYNQFYKRSSWCKDCSVQQKILKKMLNNT